VSGSSVKCCIQGEEEVTACESSSVGACCEAGRVEDTEMGFMDDPRLGLYLDELLLPVPLVPVGVVVVVGGVAGRVVAVPIIPFGSAIRGSSDPRETCLSSDPLIRWIFRSSIVLVSLLLEVVMGVEGVSGVKTSCC
jgi:hypothetical protein